MDTNYMYNQKPWQKASFYNNPNMNYPTNLNLVSYTETRQPTNMYYFANIPMGLAKSLEGKYFTGVAEDLEFGNATHAWARLYNPPDSGVNLFVNVWTASDLSSSPFKVQIWLNSNPPGIIQESTLVTPSNTAFVPLSKPRVKLEYAVGEKGFPTGGIKTFGRNGLAGTTINSEEEGKFIFPPGGSFLVHLSNPRNPTLPAAGSVAFGWWEEPIQQ